MKDKHFQEQRGRLAAKGRCLFTPIYPVNEWLASDLIIDEIDCRTYEQDLEKADGDNEDDETIWLFLFVNINVGNTAKNILLLIAVVLFYNVLGENMKTITTLALFLF